MILVRIIPEEKAPDVTAMEKETHVPFISSAGISKYDIYRVGGRSKCKAVGM